MVSKQQRPFKQSENPKSSLVVRVAPNRFVLSYKTVAEALEAARDIQKKGTFQFPRDLKLDGDALVIVDAGVGGENVEISFAFKVICCLEETTLLEWWPRRRTDPDLLDLWLEILTHITQNQENDQDLLENAKQIFEFCRRSISDNPYQSLGLKPHCTIHDVTSRYHDLINLGLALKKRATQHPSFRVRLDQAITSIEQANSTLTAQFASLSP